MSPQLSDVAGRQGRHSAPQGSWKLSSSHGVILPPQNRDKLSFKFQKRVLNAPASPPSSALCRTHLQTPPFLFLTRGEDSCTETLQPGEGIVCDCTRLLPVHLQAYRVFEDFIQMISSKVYIHTYTLYLLSSTVQTFI